MVNHCARDLWRLPSTPARHSPVAWAGGPLFNDLLNRPYAIGERCRARLQDDRGLDLAQIAIAHGGDLTPARPHRDALGPEFLAAPGAEHDIGGAPRHLQRIGDDAVAPERFACELREAVFPAGQ